MNMLGHKSDDINTTKVGNIPSCVGFDLMLSLKFNKLQLVRTQTQGQLNMFFRKHIYIFNPNSLGLNSPDKHCTLHICAKKVYEYAISNCRALC